MIPVVISGDSDLTRAILLLRAYSFQVLLVRPDNVNVHRDFLASTPYQMIWTSNSTARQYWGNTVCVMAEKFGGLWRRKEGSHRYKKRTAAISGKIREVVNLCCQGGRYPKDGLLFMKALGTPN